jgi:hypothetical protein
MLRAFCSEAQVLAGIMKTHKYIIRYRRASAHASRGRRAHWQAEGFSLEPASLPPSAAQKENRPC